MKQYTPHPLLTTIQGFRHSRTSSIAAKTLILLMLFSIVLAGIMVALEPSPSKTEQESEDECVRLRERILFLTDSNAVLRTNIVAQNKLKEQVAEREAMYSDCVNKQEEAIARLLEMNILKLSLEKQLHTLTNK